MLLKDHSNYNKKARGEESTDGKKRERGTASLAIDFSSPKVVLLMYQKRKKVVLLTKKSVTELILGKKCSLKHIVY